MLRYDSDVSVSEATLSTVSFIINVLINLFQLSYVGEQTSLILSAYYGWGMFFVL